MAGSQKKNTEGGVKPSGQLIKVMESFVETSNETQKAIKVLAESVDTRDDGFDERIRGIEKEVSRLTSMIFGERGDNGMVARMLLVEQQRAQISWHSIGVIIALIIAGASLAFP